MQPKAPVGQDIFAAWKELSDSDGLTPYIDYATPTFYDDFSGAVQRLMAGKVKPDAFTKAVQEDYAKFADNAVTALAPPGEPRRVAYLYLLPGLVDLRPVRAGAAACTARGCRCSAGTA